MRPVSPLTRMLLAGVLSAGLTACAVPALPQIAFNQSGSPASSVKLSEPVRTAGQAAAAGPDGEQALEQLYSRVNPAVVNITVVAKDQAAPSGLTVPELPGFPQFQAPTPSTPGVSVGEGSGFVYDNQGHIVTNNHVVANAAQIKVTFADGVEAAGTVVGAAPDADLAVIKVDVDPSELHPLALGESDALKVGQTAVAIGNPFGLAGSMTTGIVSGLGRLLADGGQTPAGGSYSIPDIIQTDAAINPGNSGGPLLDLAGDVIGVNTAIESPVRGSSGVGYAVPAAIVRQVVPALIEHGRYDFPYLGITGTTLGADLAKAMHLEAGQRGVLVVAAAEGGPAAKAGLRGSATETQVAGLPAKIGGDVIVKVDSQPVSEFSDLLSYLVRHTRVGQAVQLEILRDGRSQTMSVTLAARPAASP
ncbi:MAG: trypsin-like peptidase domain-containing protein [Anaerolineales bacterium]|nr:trypsin-like peptidase domain-containing protein [Anaerolineales bacterium]